MLFNKIAEVITVEEEIYGSYNFSSWVEISEYKRQFENGYDHDWVSTPNLTLIVPRIIKVLRYDKVRSHKVKLTRRNIYYRDSNICQYCGKKFKTQNLNIDHIIPRSRGGKDAWNNLVCACVKCNIKKGSKLPHEAGMRLIKEPVKPRLDPLIGIYISKKKYASWKNFLNEAYWNTPLND